MNSCAKILGWAAVGIAIISILKALQDIGLLLFIGFGEASPLLRAYWLTMIILPLAMALLLVVFGIAVLYSKPSVRVLAHTYALGQFTIAVLTALGTYLMFGQRELFMKILATLSSLVSLPFLLAIVLVIYFKRKSPESQQAGAAYPPPGDGSPDS